MSAAFICFSLIALPALKDLPPVEQVIRLNVQAMAAPRPALRYHLLPEISELQPGNPIPAYLKCLLDQDFAAGEESLGPAALRQVDRAARLDKPDWQLLLKLKTDGFGLLLPDLQKMRELITVLQKRFREEIAQHRFDDAMITAKTMFALTRHTGCHPTLIGNLVGIAIGTISLASLEEMLQQPGCPNLYWALTDLPYPLVSIASGLDGERALMTGEFRNLSRTEPMTAAQIKKVVDHIELLRSFERGKLTLTTRQWLNVHYKDEKYLAAARARLLEAGFTEEKLAMFPADQVLLLDAMNEFDICRDDATKYMKLPTWEYEAYAKKMGPPKVTGLLEAFVPSYRKVRRAQGRIEQRVALLRHVEAIRMYAAGHGGRLPAQLADIEAPLPVDPYTGKPFRYAKDGDTAHLRGSPPAGMEQIAAYNLHYEITIRK